MYRKWKKSTKEVVWIRLSPGTSLNLYKNFLSRDVQRGFTPQRILQRSFTSTHCLEQSEVRVGVTWSFSTNQRPTLSHPGWGQLWLFLFRLHSRLLSTWHLSPWWLLTKCRLSSWWLWSPGWSSSSLWVWETRWSSAERLRPPRRGGGWGGGWRGWGWGVLVLRLRSTGSTWTVTTHASSPLRSREVTWWGRWPWGGPYIGVMVRLGRDMALTDQSEASVQVTWSFSGQSGSPGSR